MTLSEVHVSDTTSIEVRHTMTIIYDVYENNLPQYTCEVCTRKRGISVYVSYVMYQDLVYVTLAYILRRSYDMMDLMSSMHTSMGPIHVRSAHAVPRCATLDGSPRTSSGKAVLAESGGSVHPSSGVYLQLAVIKFKIKIEASRDQDKTRQDNQD